MGEKIGPDKNEIAGQSARRAMFEFALHIGVEKELLDRYPNSDDSDPVDLHYERMSFLESQHSGAIRMIEVIKQNHEFNFQKRLKQESRGILFRALGRLRI